MAYTRCECKVGDVPHPPEAEHLVGHQRQKRCRRRATRRIRKCDARKGPWYTYCDPCADAILAYQGPIVEEGPKL